MPLSTWGRRTKRCATYFTLTFVILLVVTLLGAFPISWIFSSRETTRIKAEAEQYLPNEAEPPSAVPKIHSVAGSDGFLPSEYIPPNRRATVRSSSLTVDIYSDAAIGDYLWSHILKGRYISKRNGELLHGFLKISNVNFRFKTGPALDRMEFIEERHIVLVLNGRNDAKVQRAKRWLEVVLNSPNVENVGVVLLGNEQCNNEWFLWYLESSKYKIQAAFIVYDTKLVDGKKVFQWPLGVATYRGFPLLNLQSDELRRLRKYLCHFMGTVYQNNSRLQLMKALEASDFKAKCYVKARYEWPELETEQSAIDYLKTLEESESVLSPVGMNAECYRIYEALSVGSLPVIEDQKTSGVCDNPYRLLKEYNVPAVFISDWEELPGILEYLASLSEEELTHQRNKVIKWYRKFLDQMKDKFVEVIKTNFVF